MPERQQTFILYLEPSNPLFRNIESYTQKSGEIVGHTEAHMYPPHCSLTGHFNANDTEFIETLDSLISNVEFTVEFKGVIQTKESVRIGIKVSESLIEKIHEFKTKIPSLAIRTKPMDHISLAYTTSLNLVEQNPSLNFAKFFEMTNDHIQKDYSDLEWSVVLLELMHKSNEIGKKHIFRRIKRWNYKKSSNHCSKAFFAK